MNSISPELVTTLYVSPKTALSFSLKQWQKIILVLRHQQLLARYAQRFRQFDIFKDLPAYARHHLINAEVIAHNQKVQVSFEASELTRILSKKSDYLIFLKGAAYSLSSHPVGVGRLYSDIDVLVNKPSLKTVEIALFMQGWLTKKLSDYDDNYYRKWAHEIPPMHHSKRGTVIDIHHNIVPIVSGRAPNVEPLIKEVIISLDGYSILSPAAMTLHSIVHLFFNENVSRGYRDLIDIHLLMSTDTDEIYWQKLLQLANETGFAFELYLACRYTAKLLQTDIPHNVSEALSTNQRATIKMFDFMYERVLQPIHPYSTPSFFNVADFMVFIRGHFLKMPFHILTYHLLAKMFRGLVKGLLGKHFFENQLNKP